MVTETRRPENALLLTPDLESLNDDTDAPIKFRLDFNGQAIADAAVTLECPDQPATGQVGFTGQDGLVSFDSLCEQMTAQGNLPSQR